MQERKAKSETVKTLDLANCLGFFPGSGPLFSVIITGHGKKR